MQEEKAKEIAYALQDDGAERVELSNEDKEAIFKPSEPMDSANKGGAKKGKPRGRPPKNGPKNGPKNEPKTGRVKKVTIKKEKK